MVDRRGDVLLFSCEIEDGSDKDSEGLTAFSGVQDNVIGKDGEAGERDADRTGKFNVRWVGSIRTFLLGAD